MAVSENLTDDDGAAPRNAEGAIRALIVAEVRLYRDGLADVLRGQEVVSILATVADANDALARAQSLRPDVILVDMTLVDALPAVRALARDVPEARILALAVPEVEKQVIACVEAGATGCVPPDASLEQVVSAVESISRGEAPCSPLMTAAVFKRVRKLARGRAEDLDERLTAREREVIVMIDEGLSNKKIAERLSLQTATVKNHVHNILEKLGVSSRGEAAAAVRRGSGTKRNFTSIVVPFLSDALGEPVGVFLPSLWS